MELVRLRKYTILSTRDQTPLWFSIFFSSSGVTLFSQYFILKKICFKWPFCAFLGEERCYQISLWRWAALGWSTETDIPIWSSMLFEWIDYHFLNYLFVHYVFLHFHLCEDWISKKKGSFKKNILLLGEPTNWENNIKVTFGSLYLHVFEIGLNEIPEPTASDILFSFETSFYLLYVSGRRNTKKKCAGSTNDSWRSMLVNLH